MQAQAFEWFLWKSAERRPFCGYIACGDTFHAKARDGTDIFEPCTLFDIRVALECMLETRPEVGKWSLVVEEAQEHILRVTFIPAVEQ